MPMSMDFCVMAGMAVVMRSVFPLVIVVMQMGDVLPFMCMQMLVGMFMLVRMSMLMTLLFVLLHMLMRVLVRMPVRMRMLMPVCSTHRCLL